MIEQTKIDLTIDEINQLIDVILITEGITDDTELVTVDKVGEIVGKSVAFTAMVLEYRRKHPGKTVGPIMNFLHKIDDMLGIHREHKSVSIN